MSQFMILPPDGVVYGSQLSPSLALINLLPLVNLSAQFPGLEPWTQALPDRFNEQARADFALMTVLLFSSLADLGLSRSQWESVDGLLDHLQQMPAPELAQRVLRGIAPAWTAEATDPLDLLHDPERLRQAILSVPIPTPDEPVPPDVDRIMGLLGRPDELKVLLVTRLNELWEKHLRPHWEQSLPAMQQSALQTRRHFGLGGPAQVFQAVTGRPVPDLLTAELPKFREIIFLPCSFLGPYVTLGREANGTVLRVSYGIGIQPPAGPAETEESALPGGLLPALTALADETRLQILAIIRSRGQGCAQEFMADLGLSQPAASRHLRLLESTGILDVERVEGVKWYRISPTRAAVVADSVRRFLTEQA